MLLRPRRTWVAALSVTYAIPLSALAAVAGAGLVLPSLPSLLATFLPWLYAPWVLILPLSFWARSRVAVGAALVATACFVATYGRLYLPRLSSPPPSSLTIRALTFNVGWDQRQPERLADAILGDGADLVALEELYGETASFLNQRLADAYPYRILDLDGYSSGLLSKLPILEQGWFSPAGRGRSALRAVVQWEGAPVAVYVVHPNPPGFPQAAHLPLPIGQVDTWRIDEVRDIVSRTAAETGSVLVMGDFNMSAQHPAYRVMTRALGDSYGEAGWGMGFTWPHDQEVFGITVPLRLIRIDYIFHSAELYASSARVGCNVTSDHCYLNATFSHIDGS